MSLPTSSAHLLNDIIKSNDPAVFYSSFYSPLNASSEKQDQQQDQPSHFQQQPPPQQQQQQQQTKQLDNPNQHQRKKQRRQGSTSSKPLTSSASPVLTTIPTISTSGTTHDERSFTGFNMTTPHLSSETEYDLDSSTSPTASPTTTSLADSGNDTGNSTTEIRRQIHIQSEQKRRAQIKCGFEELRNELPTCLNKKMSKVALLHRSKYLDSSSSPSSSNTHTSFVLQLYNTFSILNQHRSVSLPNSNDWSRKMNSWNASNNPSFKTKSCTRYNDSSIPPSYLLPLYTSIVITTFFSPPPPFSNSTILLLFFLIFFFFLSLAFIHFFLHSHSQ